jgi:hypothetical protein
MKFVAQIDLIPAELVDACSPIRLQVDRFRPALNSHDGMWDRIKLGLSGHPNDKSVTLEGLARVSLGILSTSAQRTGGKPVHAERRCAARSRRTPSI